MAAKKTKSPVRAPDNKALQRSDLPPSGRKALDGSFSAAHSNTATRAAQFRAAGTGTPRDQAAVAAVQPYLKDKKVTISTAATARTKAFTRASNDADTKLAGEDLPGAGWYFNHHADLAKSASDHGFDTNLAITASAVMSPQNSPENEKASVNALMKAHTSGSVEISPEVHAHLSKQGVPVDPSHVGQTVRVNDLHPSAVAALSDPVIRDHVRGSNFDAKDIARGGSRENISKAVDVLRGNTSEEDALSPHGAPKVYSYRGTIRDAVPGTDIHKEYMLRASDIASHERGEQIRGQSMFDYYGKRQSDEGLLSPDRSTAQDTWMNSISTDQPNEMVPGGRQNVMKTAGSLINYSAKKVHDGVSVIADPRVKSSSVLHAGNDAATIKSGAQLEKKHNLNYKVPSTLVQEVPWTQVRRAGGKDPEFNAAKGAENAADKASRHTSFVQGHQMSIFGDK